MASGSTKMATLFSPASLSPTVGTSILLRRAILAANHNCPRTNGGFLALGFIETDDGIAGTGELHAVKDRQLGTSWELRSAVQRHAAPCHRSRNDHPCR